MLAYLQVGWASGFCNKAQRVSPNVESALPAEAMKLLLRDCPAKGWSLASLRRFAGEVGSWSPGLSESLPIPTDDSELEPSECAPKDWEDVVPPQRVLIIEDQFDAADAIASCLRVAGHTVAVASNGEAGLALAREMEPQVLLCDIWLPGVDGYFVRRALKSDPSMANCYCVAISGVEFRKTTDAMFDEYLRKPVDADALLSIMRHAYDRQKANQQ